MSQSQPAEESPVVRKRRGRRWIRRTLLGLLALLAIALVVVRIGLDEWARQLAIRQLAALSGMEVQLEELHIELRTLSAEWSGLELSSGADDADEMRLSVARGKVRLPWSALIGLRQRSVRLAEVRLEQPRVTTKASWFDRRAERETQAATPLDLRIDMLHLIDGVWVHDDASRQLDLRLAGVAVDGTWSADRRVMLGALSFDLEVLRDPIVRALPLRVTGQFRWREQRVDVFEATALGGGLQASFGAAIEFDGPLKARSSGTLQADLDAFAPLLDPGFPAVGGRVRGDLRLTLGPGPLHVEGDARARTARFGTIRADEATAHVDFRPGRLALDSLQASAFGGLIHGSVHVALETATTLELDLRGAEMEASRLLQWLQLELPLSGDVAATLRMSGDADRRTTWDAAGTFSVAPRVVATAGRLPTAGSGEFSLSHGQVALRAENTAIAGAVLDVHVSADVSGERTEGTLTLTGITADARRTQRGALRILEALGLEWPTIVEQPLSGAGQVSTRVSFGGIPNLELALDLTAGDWGAQSFDRAQVQLDLAGTELSLRQVNLQQQDALLVGSARFDVEPFGLRQVDARAENLQLGVLLPLIDLPPEVRGLLSGTMVADAGERGLEGSGRLTLRDVVWQQESLDRVEAQVEFLGERIRFYELRAQGPAAEVQGEVVVDQQAMTADLRLESSKVVVEKLSAVSSNALPLSGVLRFVGDLRANASGLLGELDVTGEGARFDQIPLGDFSGHLRVWAEGLEADLDAESAFGWRAAGTLGWSESLPLQAAVHLREAIVEPQPGRDPPVWGRLTGNFLVQGPLATPERLAVDGTLLGAELQVGARDLRLQGESPVRLHDGVWHLGPFRLMGPVSDLQAVASYDTASGAIDGSARGSLNLGLLTVLLPEVRAHGELGVDLRAGGTLEQPIVAGGLTLQGGRLRYLGFPHTLDQIEAEVRFDGARAEVREMRALLGGGEVRGTGHFTVGAGGLESFALEWTGANVRVALPEHFEGVYEGRLALSGSPEQARLGGELRMLRGLYDAPFDVSALLGYGVREYAGDDLGALPENVTLGIDVIADGNVWVRNELAEVETRLEAGVGGTLRRPQIVGRLWMLEGGKLRFRDAEYEIRSGSLDFVDPEEFNPYLLLDAETRVRGHEVFLHVEGTLDRFEYELTSNPALSPQDIIMLLTTGRTLQELYDSGTGGAQFTGDLAANYFAGALTDRFERQLKRALGLERLEINPLLANGTDPTTRVTVGKKVNDDVTVIVSSEIGSEEDELYQVEWQATRRATMTVERDTNGGLGANVRYTNRYWWKKPQGPREAAVPSGAPAPATTAEAPTVSTIRIDGVPGVESTMLAKRVPLKVGEPFRRSRMFAGVESIRRWYVKQDRIRVDVSARATEATAESPTVDVVYDVEPGPVIGVVFDGVTKKEQKQLRTLLDRLWTESLFNEGLYGDAVARIREFYQQRGFYAVDVEYDELDTPAGGRLQFRVDRGQPVRVAEIRIEGAEQLSEARVQKQMLTRPRGLLGARSFDRQVLRDDVEAIKSLYRDQGYLQAQIAEPRIRLSATGDAVDITLQIDEGPQFTVSRLEIGDTPGFTRAELAEWSELAPGAVFSPNRLLASESALRRAVDQRGYPAAKIRSRVELEDSQVVVHLDVDPGQRMTVAEIAVIGNDVTRERVIRRQLVLRQGDLLSREKLLRSQHALYRLGVFRSVRLEHKALNGAEDGQRVIEVRVQEAPPLSVGVGVGYNTESKINFSVNTAQNNLGGKMRTLGFQGEVNNDLRRVQLLGKVPRVFGTRLPGLASLLWEERDETGFTVERRATALRIDRKFSPRWSGYARYGYQRVDVFDVTDPTTLLGEKLENVILGDVGIAIERDTRDDKILPRRGNLFRVGAQVFADPLLSQFEFTKTTLTESHTWTLRNGVSVVTALRIGVADPFGSTSDVPVSERFFAGGDSTIRGFERDRLGPLENDQPVGGEGMLLLNQELRFPLWRRLKGELFYDAGNVYRRLADFDATELRHVMGAGLRVETPIGPLRLEYGWKLDREPGEAPGQFFLAIGTAF